MTQITEEYLIERGFEHQETVSWYGNGADYVTSPNNGGSQTIQNDYILTLDKSDRALVVRFEEFIYKAKEKVKSDGISITIHYGNWYPKIYDPIPCYDPSTIECLELAYKLITNNHLISN